MTKGKPFKTLLLPWLSCFKVHGAVFRDSLLHTVVVMSGYLSYFPISQSSLTSDM